jgi:polyisoprenoid-binding protein YceI
MPNVLWALLVTATLPANATFSVDAAASTIRYTVIHKLHHVEGISHGMEAKAIVKDDGSILAMVRIPVVSFRSGDGNRDEHMVEALDAGKFPFVVLKGTARLGPKRELPNSPVNMEGEVDLHGVKTPVAVPVSLALQADGSVRARGSFDVSLEAHHIERPSLLFVKIEDGCHIDFDLVMRGSQ